MKHEEGAEGVARAAEVHGSMPKSPEQLTKDHVESVRHQLPCEDYDDILPFVELRRLNVAYDAAASSEDLKQLRAEHALAVEKVRVLINAAKRSVADLSRARAQRQKKIMNDAAKEKTEKIRAAAKEAVAAKARAKARSRAWALQQYPIFSHTFPVEMTMSTFLSPEVYEIAREGGEVSGSEPFVICHCKRLMAFGAGDCEHREDMDYFLDAFKGSTQEKTHGRGVVYVDSKVWLDKMLAFAPGDVLNLTQDCKFDARTLGKMAGLSMFAYSVKMAYIGTDLGDVAGLRLNLGGSRRLVACSFADIRVVVAAAKPNSSVSMDSVRSFLEDLDDEGLTELVKENPRLFKVVSFLKGDLGFEPCVPFRTFLFFVGSYLPTFMF